MTRKEPEKETERPHYYSQFWLDIAAGRRAIGTKVAAEVEDDSERDGAESARGSRNSRAGSTLSASGAATASMPPATTIPGMPGTADQRRIPAIPEPIRGGLSSLVDLDLVIEKDDKEELEEEDILEEEAADTASPLADIAIGADLEDLDILEEEEKEEEELDFEDALFGEDEEDEWGIPRTRKPSKSNPPHKKPDKKSGPRRRERGREF